MEFYEHQATDPPWLAKAAEFHGHLGPWVTVGAMIGSDALQRLKTRGQWTIEVICWMPPAKQRPPFSCILDGLQASSGATMGKRNIRFEFSPDIVRRDQPVVYVISRPPDGAPSGVVYHLKDKLVTMTTGVAPDRLEAVSREIAAASFDTLFDVRGMTAQELASVERRP